MMQSQCCLKTWKRKRKYISGNQMSNEKKIMENQHCKHVKQINGRITDFGTDGGSALRAMEPKIALLRSHISSLGVSLPEFQLKHLLMIAIALEGLGGILFLFESRLGAYLLLIFLAVVTPIMHDFYNYDISSLEYVREFLQFLKNLSLFGSLLYFLGMKNHAAKKSRKQGGKAKAI